MVQRGYTGHVCIDLAHDSSRQSQKFDILVTCNSHAKFEDTFEKCVTVNAPINNDWLTLKAKKFAFRLNSFFSLTDRFHI